MHAVDSVVDPTHEYGTVQYNYGYEFLGCENVLVAATNVFG